MESIEKYKKTAEQILNKTVEGFNNAKQAVTGLDPTVIQLKGYQKPQKWPKCLIKTLEAVMILLQKPLDLDTIQSEMKTPNLFIK